MAHQGKRKKLGAKAERLVSRKQGQAVLTVLSRQLGDLEPMLARRGNPRQPEPILVLRQCNQSASPGTKSARNLDMDDLLDAIRRTPMKKNTFLIEPEVTIGAAQTTVPHVNERAVPGRHSAAAAAILETNRKKLKFQVKSNT